MFLNKYEYVYKNTMNCFGIIFLNISDNYPEHCELFSNIFFSLDTLFEMFTNKEEQKAREIKARERKEQKMWTRRSEWKKKLTFPGQ